MLNEVIDALNPQKGQFFVDCTLGGGGYTEEILKKVGKDGHVLSIDLDEMAIQNAKIKLKKYKNLTLIHDNFRNIPEIISGACQQVSLEHKSPDFDKFSSKNFGLCDYISKNFSKKISPKSENFCKKRDLSKDPNFDENVKIDGIVMDLGFSSAQLDDESKGISFQNDAPLDMRFGENSPGEDTEYLINNYSEKEIAGIIREYGEEKFASNIAKKILEQRKIKKIKTTKQLAEIVEQAIPKKFRKGINPATKTFQALRLKANDELGNLKEVLPSGVELLRKGGKIAVVTFHSLEDRIVKHFFKDQAKDCICPPQFPICNCNHRAELKIITKKPISPTEEEIKNNPRARSAKLRVAEKII